MVMHQFIIRAKLRPEKRPLVKSNQSELTRTSSRIFDSASVRLHRIMGSWFDGFKQDGWGRGGVWGLVMCDSVS